MIGLQEFLQSTACVPLSAAEGILPRAAHALRLRVRARNTERAMEDSA